MIAALDTRRKKSHDVDAVHLRDVWVATAADIGFDPAELSKALGRTVGDTDRRRDEASSIEDHLLSPLGLTEHESTFDRNDVLRGMVRLALRRRTDRRPSRSWPTDSRTDSRWFRSMASPRVGR